MVDKANDGQGTEERENPLRQNLVLGESRFEFLLNTRFQTVATYHEHEDKDSPIEFNPLAAQTFQMKSLENGSDGDLARPKSLAWLDADIVEETCETVSDALTCDQHENGDTAIHLVIAVEADDV